jgi:hypothetical protein
LNEGAVTTERVVESLGTTQDDSSSASDGWMLGRRWVVDEGVFEA